MLTAIPLEINLWGLYQYQFCNFDDHQNNPKIISPDLGDPNKFIITSNLSLENFKLRLNDLHSQQDCLIFQNDPVKILLLSHDLLQINLIHT